MQNVQHVLVVQGPRRRARQAQGAGDHRPRSLLSVASVQVGTPHRELRIHLPGSCSACVLWHTNRSLFYFANNPIPSSLQPHVPCVRCLACSAPSARRNRNPNRKKRKRMVQRAQSAAEFDNTALTAAGKRNLFK